jgi:nitrite reductase (NADH) large subunit
MRHVIIGCGPAGIAAAETLRRLAPSDEITIISNEERPLYSRCLISYRLMLSDEIDISYRGKAFFKQHRILPILGRRVARITPSEKLVHLDNGQKVQYDTLLIATGGRPIIPDIPGADKKGFLAFRSTSDLAAIKALLASTRKAVVLGGGCIGLQVAAGLMASGVTVTVIIKSSHLLSQVADETTGNIYAGLFSGKGAEIIDRAEVRTIVGGERVEGVLLHNGRKIDCQLVVVGKGVIPNMEVAKEAGIRCRRGIAVDDSMMTGINDIYAAGDVAETVDAASGESTVNALWPCASEQGRVAGSNMAGSRKSYEGSLRMNTVEFFGLPMISVGRVKPPYEDREVHSLKDEKRKHYLKMVFNGDVLAGFIMVGEIGNAGVLTSLVRKRVHLGSVKEDLINGKFEFSRLIEAIQKNMDKFHEESYKETLFSFEKK